MLEVDGGVVHVRLCSGWSGGVWCLRSSVACVQSLEIVQTRPFCFAVLVTLTTHTPGKRAGR